MNKEIKNTLFRFTTMRAPNLVDVDSKSKNFINYPYTSGNVFLDAVKKTKATSRRTTLQEIAKKFEAESFKTRLEVKEYVGAKIYNFATWLTANRTTLTVVEVENELKVEIPKLTEAQKKVLWNNLLYQIITYKSGAVREIIFSVLTADFFINNNKEIENEDKAYQKLAQARIVIDKALFKQEKSLINTSGAERINTKSLDKELKKIVLKEKVAYLQEATKDIAKIQKSYTKTQQVAYKNAITNHQKNVEEAYSKADKIEQTYTDTVTKINRQQITYKNLNLPKFEFVKAPELESVKTTKIAATTTAGLNIINDLVNAEEYTTFNEVNNHINTEIAAATEEIFENTDFENTQVNYNGALIPVSQNTDIGKAFSITGNRIVATTILFRTSFNDAYVISANYQITFGANATPISGTSFTSSIVNNKLMLKIFTANEVTYLNKNNFTITGEFVLNNNRKISITGAARIINKTKLAVGAKDYTIFGNGSYTIELLSDENPTDSEPETPIDYIPSGFGIKRLGISDYRKVEQTICCYVAGEVSHIENIMAREYKDRETRSYNSKTETNTLSKETEKEKLTDTSTAERFEMNQEVASVMAKDTQLNAHASFNANWGVKGGAQYSVGTGADFSTSTASEVSDSQAVTYAKDVTERALDRVALKTKEERTVTVINEYEEKNTHGFDNRKGDNHISGVYRWVDKIYKNQVINYGKRLMYEFMIPEPAVFHNLAITTEKKISEPIDPRTFEGDGLNLKDYTKITESTYPHWAAIYNAKVAAMPERTISVSKSVSREIQGENGAGSQAGEGKIEIPEKYMLESFTGNFFAKVSKHGIGHNLNGVVLIAGKTFRYGRGASTALTSIGNNIDTNLTKTLEFSVVSWDTGAYTFNLVAACKLTDQAYKQWQIETFNTIIKAYEEKVAAYKLKATEATIAKVNPGFYRQIENMVLRKNCISYMASQENVGADLIKNRGELENIRVDYTNEKLESYAARVKFFEQAFEWNIMSYNFYPFYWANKENWKSLYNVTEFNDALHRSFLQSGMARVIVTVRPGFEEIVNWYMATGQIWNGGQVPTPDDDLFLSIVDELKEPTGTVEETWETRVPTALTVIQAGSIGLNVQGLPCNTDCNDFKMFDSDGVELLDANGKPFTNPIGQSTAQIGQSSETQQDAGVLEGGGNTTP